MNISRPTFDGTEHCIDHDTEIFFGTRTSSKYSAAREICAECPLKEPCFEYAVTNDVQGFWGGTTEKDRVEVRLLLGTIPISVAQSLADLFGRMGGALAYRERFINELKTGIASWGKIPLSDALEALSVVQGEAAEKEERIRKAQLRLPDRKRALTDDQVRDIRTSTDTHRVLGRRHRVAESTVRKVRAGLRYASVPA